MKRPLLIDGATHHLRNLYVRFTNVLLTKKGERTVNTLQLELPGWWIHPHAGRVVHPSSMGTEDPALGTLLDLTLCTSPSGYSSVILYNNPITNEKGERKGSRLHGSTGMGVMSQHLYRCGSAATWVDLGSRKDRSLRIDCTHLICYTKSWPSSRNTISVLQNVFLDTSLSVMGMEWKELSQTQ